MVDDRLLLRFGDDADQPTTVSADGEEVAWDAVRLKLQEIIDNEDKQHPKSDEQLVKDLAVERKARDEAAGLGLAGEVAVEAGDVEDVPLRILQHRNVPPADITRERDPMTVRFERDVGRPQDVPGVAECDVDARDDLEPVLVLVRAEALHRLVGVLARVDRLDRRVVLPAPLVQELRLRLLEGLAHRAAAVEGVLDAETVGDFVGRHPTIRMLALSFLLMIGVMLMVEGTGNHVPKGYIYFAMAFSLGVELLNIRIRRPGPVKLHSRYGEESATG